MRQPRSLGGRLALFYVSALVVGLVVFAAFALVTIDRVQRASTDAALASEAAAAATVVLPEADSGGLDEDEVHTFRGVLGVRANWALFDVRGGVKFSTVTDLPDAITALGTSENAVTRDVDIDGTKSRAVVARVARGRGRFGTIVLWRPIADFGDVDRRAALGFAVAIPLLALAALVVGRRLARRALQPLRALSELIAEIEAVDLSRRLGRADDDELGALCATFDRMLERLENAFLRQRRFAGDVAHELRAPLAVVIAEIDVVRRKSRSPGDYERVLDTVRAKALALDRLTTELLASYRDDAPPRLESFRLRDAVAAAVAAQGSRVSLEESSGATVVADRSDVVRALLAIFDNARKYGGIDGTVIATVDSTASEARVTIRDAGPGFSPEALQRATDRFWRDEKTRGKEGSGLGLALARAIVERNGGSIVLGNATDDGGVVTLSFPRADDSPSPR
jgi:signal transduction histidine kinase